MQILLVAVYKFLVVIDSMMAALLEIEETYQKFSTSP